MNVITEHDAGEPLLQMRNVQIVEEPPTPDRVLVIRSPRRVRSWAKDSQLSLPS